MKMWTESTGYVLFDCIFILHFCILIFLSAVGRLVNNYGVVQHSWFSVCGSFQRLGLCQIIIQFVSSFPYDERGTLKVADFDEICWRFKFIEPTVRVCSLQLLVQPVH